MNASFPAENPYDVLAYCSQHQRYYDPETEECLECWQRASAATAKLGEFFMHQDEAKKIFAEKGEMLILASGQYSNYQHFGVFRALTTLDQSVLEPIAQEIKDAGEYYAFEFETFVETLVQRRYVERIKYKELYLGSYTTFNPCIDVDNA